MLISTTAFRKQSEKFLLTMLQDSPAEAVELKNLLTYHLRSSFLSYKLYVSVVSYFKVSVVFLITEYLAR